MTRLIRGTRRRCASGAPRCLALLPLLWAVLPAGCTLISPEDLADRLDLDRDGVARPTDCDDEDPDVQQLTFYADEDADGRGGAVTVAGCTAPAGFTTTTGDCDDRDPTVILRSWYPDADADGYGALAGVVSTCDGLYGHVLDSADCDDTRADVHPLARDYCGDGLDNNCNGILDDLPWFLDADGDHFGDAEAMLITCDPPADYVSDATDCDDSQANVNAAAPEVCDPLDVDEDCNGRSEDEDPAITGQPDWYVDQDGDGYGAGDAVTSCDAPEGRTPGIDCDDNDPNVSPVATEVWYDGIDTDCDGWNDNDADKDGHSSDTFGSETATGDDCEDADPTRHGGAADVPDDGIDQNCSGADFDLLSCIDTTTEATFLAYSFAPARLTGSIGGSCWAGASYEISQMENRFYEAEASVTAYADEYRLEVELEGQLNSSDDPFRVEVELLCESDTCDGYVSPLSASFSLRLVLLGTGVVGNETVVELSSTDVVASVEAGSSATHTDCAGGLTDVLDFFGSSPTDLLATAIDDCEEELQVGFATTLVDALEANCRE